MGDLKPSGCFSHSTHGSYLAYGPLEIPGTHSQVANNYFNKSQNLAKDSQNLAKSANIAVQTTLFVAIVRSTYKGTLITHVTCLMASILTESGSQTVFNIFRCLIKPDHLAIHSPILGDALHIYTIL